MAFSAYPLDDYEYVAPQGSPGTHSHTVTFNGVLLNAGDAYDASTSIFTCPIAGYYAFFGDVYIKSFSYSTYPADASLSINKGSAILHTVMLTVYPEPTIKANDATFHVTTTCQQGEEVRVNIRINHPNGHLNTFTLKGHDDGIPFSTFSGHILRDGL